jgi:hypothetical protein
MHETTNSGPTIFLIEEDNHARTALTRFLRKHGYRLLVAADIGDAFEWMSGTTYIHADLLLINLLGKSPEEALSVGRSLREHSKYDGDTPIVVMPERVPANLHGTDETLNNLEWVCYYEDVNQLARLLAGILKPQ